MSSDLTSGQKVPPTDTETQIKSLIESLSAEIEREISIKECRQAASNASLDIAA
tara:strand:- start:25228 stop:25389 length:162 start_codon:yes stop_codon:yes gene_type:complete